VLFLGFCYYKANEDAAERLVRTIFPLIRVLVPEAQLIIAGSGSEDLPSRSEKPEGVYYLGYVEDLHALYASARVICCPVTHGSGTRMKLIEAAAYARPMVSTKLAAEGLDFAEGTEILICEDDQSIAAACVRLLRDDVLSKSMGSAARALAIEKYDAEAVRYSILQLMSQADASENVGSVESSTTTIPKRNSDL
jgi:glycosyltransferase involved in cell wall biosynthesis